MGATTVGVIGLGYWGPNLLRNFAENKAAELPWICDADTSRLAAMGRLYPAAQTTTDYRKLLSYAKHDAIAEDLPAATPFQIAITRYHPGRLCLSNKSLTPSV